MHICKSTSIQRVITRLFTYVAAIACMLSVASVSALAQTSGNGSITGRVMNQATGKYLANVVVTVEGTNIQVLTDDIGGYRILNIAAGSYTVSATYIDLDKGASNVTVVSGETATVDFNLTSQIYHLEKFVVSSEREGAAKALQDQRFSDTMLNVVAADSFGNMVDGNIGELMKKLPGVAIDYAGEDPGAMRIRGMDASMASVTLDGNPIASGGGGSSRAFDLSSFAVQNIDSIELNFAPTPREPSHNMGGSINFKTRNAFAQKGRRIRIDGNLSLNTTALEFEKNPGGERTPDRKLKPGLMLAYSEAFGSTRPFGVSVVANFYQRYRYNNNYTLPGGYAYSSNALLDNGGIATADMQGRIGAVQWEESGASSERRNLAVNLDWKISDNTTLFLRTSYTNDIDLGRYVHRFRINAGTHLDATPLYGDSNFDNMVGRSSNAAVTSYVSNKDTKLWNVALGAEHKFGRFEIDYDVYASQSKFEPDPAEYFNISYGQTGINMTVLDVSGNASGLIHQTDANGVDLPGDWSYLDVSKYNSLSMTQDYDTGADEQMGAKFHVAFPVTVSNKAGTTSFPLKIEFGGMANQQKRDTEKHYRAYRLTGNSQSSSFGTASEPTLQQFADPYYGNSWGGTFDTPIPQWLSPHQVYDHFTANPDQFYYTDTDLTNIISSAFGRIKSGDRESTERIFAGYIMATANISRLTIMGGVRQEFTRLEGWGYTYEQGASFSSGGKYDTVNEFLPDANGNRTIPNPIYQWNVATSPNYNPVGLSSLLYTRSKRVKDYDGLFPNVQLKYDITPNFTARAAYTTGMSRPNYNDVLWATDNVSTAYKLIRRPNANLESQTHDLYQLRLEYYFKKFGSVTLTGFYQPYKNYIYTVSYYEPYLYEDVVEMWEVNMKRNVGDGRNYGFEFSYQQRLGFIADWLNRVEFYATFSWADPTAKYPFRPAPDHVLTDEEAEAYNKSPVTWVDVPLNDIKRRYAVAAISYKGPKFFASVTTNWTDEYTKDVNTDNLSETHYAENIRMDLSLGYRLSRHWETYFDWRNFTDVPDERSIFNRTGGYYTSGMVMNLGVRANF